MATATVYKNGILLGTGTVLAGATSITSFTAYNPGLAHDVARRIGTGRNVRVACTGFATSNGVYRSKVVLDGGATLTMSRACPFA
jgi:hypothetical protein